MTSPTIHASYKSVSASKLVGTAGDALALIKEEDALTDADLAEELGRGEDQAAKYRKAEAEMSMTTFLRACRRWNGRFANPIFALIGLKLVPLDALAICARRGLTVIMNAITLLSRHLEDGELSDTELVESRAAIEAAAAVFDGYRQRLAVIDSRK